MKVENINLATGLSLQFKDIEGSGVKSELFNDRNQYNEYMKKMRQEAKERRRKKREAKKKKRY